ncbi:hypothetical protein F6V25_10445 [Oryzomonas japonica]|uniref:Uncharacterized protein n=1 Tax=Oryzomonas japonica TaxID=2603858 RepID=A0A7J4ZPT3_9BACT|nr:hypothetical protein [Oryzomonas japonica]KAB0665036.1 hypothetical protein F6V25_10445 [Oryzomonas japonica]
MPFMVHMVRLTVLIFVGEMGAAEVVGCDGGEHPAAGGRSLSRHSCGRHARLTTTVLIRSYSRVCRPVDAMGHVCRFLWCGSLALLAILFMILKTEINISIGILAVKDKKTGTEKMPLPYHALNSNILIAEPSHVCNHCLLGSQP